MLVLKLKGAASSVVKGQKSQKRTETFFLKFETPSQTLDALNQKQTDRLPWFVGKAQEPWSFENFQ